MNKLYQVFSENNWLKRAVFKALRLSRGFLSENEGISNCKGAPALVYGTLQMVCRGFSKVSESGVPHIRARIFPKLPESRVQGTFRAKKQSTLGVICVLVGILGFGSIFGGTCRSKTSSGMDPQPSCQNARVQEVMQKGYL